MKDTKKKMAKCLVTGGAGFIGSHVVDSLVEEGHEVTVIDNFSSGQELNLNPKADLMIDDILKVDWDKMPEFDYVFHLAAVPRVQYSIEHPLETHEENITGTLKVLEYCRRVDAKVIFSSSSSVYEGQHLPTMESDQKHPRSPYALQKLISEQYITLYSELFDVDYTILRYFNVYGERASAKGSYPLVIALFLDQKRKGLPLTITNDGENRRDFTYVKDVARANLLAMKWPRGVYNIGAGENHSVNQIARYIGGETVNIGPRLGEPRETLAENSKAKSLGWKPTMSVEKWINENKSIL